MLYAKQQGLDKAISASEMKPDWTTTAGPSLPFKKTFVSMAHKHLLYNHTVIVCFCMFNFLVMCKSI